MKDEKNTTPDFTPEPTTATGSDEAIPEGARVKPKASKKETGKQEGMSMEVFMGHMRKNEKVRIGNKLYLGKQNANQIIYQKDKVGKMPLDPKRYVHYMSVRTHLVNAKLSDK